MNHEKLICYRNLVLLAEELSQISQRWPHGTGYLADQLKRAVVSAVLNLAEGNGKRAYTKERKRFFQISLGSLAETSACLDLAKAFRLINEGLFQNLKGKILLSYHQINKLP